MTGPLSAGYRTVAVDLVGGGIDEMAADVASGLRNAAIGPATVVGHSMGGMVAQQLYAADPGLVQGLVLCATTGGVTPAYAQSSRAMRDLIEAKGTKALAAMMAPGLFGDDYREAHPERVAAFTETVAASDARSLIRMLEGVAAFDLLDRLQAIAVPTVVVVGEHDPFRADCDHLAATIPGATLTVIDGIGHMTPMEAPEAVVDAIAGAAERGREAQP